MGKHRLLFESIFNSRLTGEETVNKLKAITGEHPYFSVAQFYLLQLTKENTAGYKIQAKKTGALFNNNYWLNFQLLEAGMGSTPEKANETIPGENFIARKEAESPVTYPQKEKVIEPAINIDTADENTEETAANAMTEENTRTTETENVPDPITFNSVAEELRAEEPVAPGETNGKPAEESAAETVPAGNTDAPLFEPLHTTDYFASVGIKLSEEEKTADKLGKQLKSFTDWLKTMKKIHAQQLVQSSQPADVATDGNIQKLAEKSNREEEVLTEAMADVLLQQGRQDKAVEILEKLSLLNPPKSAYFAAKINQIKEK